VYSTTRKATTLSKALANIHELTPAELDGLIDDTYPVRGRNAELMHELLGVGLSLAGRATAYYAILKAKYLWMVKKMFDQGAWPEDTYVDFADWVRSFYAVAPFGLQKSTSYTYVMVWELYHVLLGMDVEWMAQAGWSKLVKMRTIVAQTVSNGSLDPDVQAVLEDPDTGWDNCIDVFKSRKDALRAIEVEGRLVNPDTGEVFTDSDVLGEQSDDYDMKAVAIFRLHTSGGHNGAPGMLEVWHGNTAVELGNLYTDDPAAMEWIALLCERGKVKLL